MPRAISEHLDEARKRELLSSLAEEARRYRFEVAPNPCVGAAIYSGDREVARGFHEYWGGPHAEIAVMERADRAGVPRGSWDTLLVTLEPCTSTGKTPPCLDSVLAAGFRRVVVGAVDPDLRHHGKGLELLRRAGVEVELLHGVTPLDRVAPHFLSWTSHERLRRPRPWTIAKWAQTRSGMLIPPADYPGGRWISSARSREEVALLRSCVDAIVTGVGTVLADDPRLSVRIQGFSGNPPMRVVLDSYLRTPVDARLLKDLGGRSPDEAAGPVHLLCQAGANGMRHRALAARGAQISGLHSNHHDHVELRDVQSWLWSHGVRRAMIEAGPTLLARYFELGFIDQIRVYTGEVRGGRGESLANWLGAARLGQRLDRECGPDSVLEAFTGE
jgi:diaminohydroxyphosphoribosylaminopyrimidine deaminase/5-amino-6-(5-phosphoribosylamino)uracil reductase